MAKVHHSRMVSLGVLGADGQGETKKKLVMPAVTGGLPVCYRDECMAKVPHSLMVFLGVLGAGGQGETKEKGWPFPR